MAEYIAMDFTGVFTGVQKTTMYAQFEHLHQNKPGNPTYGRSALEDYCKVTEQFGKTASSSSSDHALKEWFLTMGETYCMTKKDMESTIDRCFEDGTINQDVVNAVITLAKEYGKKIVIVSKNPKDEVAYFAKKVNELAGKEVIYGTIGSELEYDDNGVIVGVSRLVSDKKSDGSIDDTLLVLKSGEVSKYSTDYDFVSDEKDLDIAKVADKSNNKSILLRHLPDGKIRDPYFAGSVDYQTSTLESGAYNTIVLDGDGLMNRLVRELSEEKAKQSDESKESAEEQA